MASFYWCETCHRVYPAGRIESGRCPNGHSDLTPVGRFGGMIKGFIAAGGLEERSEAQIRHRQLIHALWSQDERDQQFYQLLTPPVSFSRFVKRMDELHLRGVDEGWMRIIMPVSPFAPASAYGIEYVDAERFVRELYALYNMPMPEAALSVTDDLATIGAPSVPAEEDSGDGGL
jgi:hypothetical protein